MDIASGLGALKSAFDIGHNINQRLKEGKSYPNEIADQLLQLQQLVLDSQRALNDAAEEIRLLKERLAAYERTDALEKDLEWVADGGFYIRKSEQQAGKQIAYCPLCWGENKKVIPLNIKIGHGYYTCEIHKTSHQTRAYQDYERNNSSSFESSGETW